MMPSKLNIVLYEPEIPQNTGNIARLCACCGASLYLVGKLGFSLSSKYTKRAGLDYWESVDLHKVDTMEDLYAQFPNGTFYYLTTKTDKLYTDIEFKDGLPQTTKGDTQWHGFGMQSIKMIVQKYGGELSAYVVDDIFHLSILFGDISSIEASSFCCNLYKVLNSLILIMTPLFL